MSPIRMLAQVLAVLGGTLFAGWLLCGTASAASRTFTSADGLQMEAEIVSVNPRAKSVTILRLPDRAQFTAPWKLFSAEDQDYLAALGAAETGANILMRANVDAALPVPSKVLLRGVPMVVQHGNFCVPASASMIARYHGLNADQDLIATLSSAGSIGNAGTYPEDMARAMEKLGFKTQVSNWDLKKHQRQEFDSEVLPIIRAGIATEGPVYVSYKAGVFGDMGHGCVIVGYDDGKKQFHLHNPWGRKFKENYDDFLWKARGVVRIRPPEKFPVATDAFIESVQEQVTALPATMTALAAALEQSGLTARFTYCSRSDERESRRFAEQTARREGRLILSLAFVRSSAVILPQSDAQGAVTGMYLITEPDSGARFNCRYFDGANWHPPELLNIGDFNKNWATRIAILDRFGKESWDLPLIELVE